MSSDFLKEIEGLIEETEAELQSNLTLRSADSKNRCDAEALQGTALNSSPVDSGQTSKPQARRSAESRLAGKQNPKHPHYGHRARVKQSADTDPDFATFSDVEMLEYLLFNTLPRIDTNELAHTLIDTFGSFSGVLSANVNELKTIPYIGEETARMLTSILPAARKAETSRLRNNTVLQNTAQAAAYLWPFFQNRNVEHVFLASLNNTDRVIAVDCISVGDTNFTTVEVKRIIETACRHKATKVVLAHNHPSGNLQPSPEDKVITSRLVVALLSVNVVMVDHMIFTADNYYSFYGNHEFEAIYKYADSVFHTNLVKELELKTTNYRAGVYPKGFDDEMAEQAIRNEYSLGHPDPRNFRVGQKE